MSNWTCPKCGAVLDEDALFCTSCGTKRPEQESDVKEEVSFCPECGAKLVPGAAFCERCGARIESEAPVEQDQDEEPLVTGDIKDETIPLDNSTKEIVITREESRYGFSRRFKLESGTIAEINVPGGIEDGSKLKIKNIIPAENGGAGYKDAILDLVIK